jgi:hypothetical protein
MTKHERAHLTVIQDILEHDGCNCTDPWDHEECFLYAEPPNGSHHPSSHGAYCPIYMAAYLQALLDGNKHPDPDDWPDAPPVCGACKRAHYVAKAAGGK